MAENKNKLKDEMEKSIDQTLQKLSDQQKKLDALSYEVGIRKQQVEDVKPFLIGLAQKAESDLSFLPIVASGLDMFSSSSDEYFLASSSLDKIQNSLYNFGGTIDSYFLSTGTIIVSEKLEPEFGQFKFTPTSPWLIKLPEDLSNRFEKLDPNLAEIHRGAWATYHSTKPDKDRLALFGMRQTYDLFFRILAPDKLVRESKYWEKKGGENEDAIYREERIVYAAYTHVKDFDRAKSLAASSKHMKEVYNLLNKAHASESIKPNDAKRALDAMDLIFIQWLDALGL